MDSKSLIRSSLVIQVADLPFFKDNGSEIILNGKAITSNMVQYNHVSITDIWMLPIISAILIQAFQILLQCMSITRSQCLIDYPKLMRSKLI